MTLGKSDADSRDMLDAAAEGATFVRKVSVCGMNYSCETASTYAEDGFDVMQQRVIDLLRAVKELGI